jgi:hypothetical protein
MMESRERGRGREVEVMRGDDRYPIGYVLGR